jgi:hypothetical protein
MSEGDNATFSVGNSTITNQTKLIVIVSSWHFMVVLSRGASNGRDHSGKGRGTMFIRPRSQDFHCMGHTESNYKTMDR